MEKVIKIDLYDKESFFEKYNKNIVSRNLIDYIVEQSIFIDKNDMIKVVINDKCNLGDNCLTMIKNGLEFEYQKNLRDCKLTNIKQFILMLIGILFLFLSTVIQEGFIFKEIFLIVGWVAIWEVIDIELFSDVKEKRKRIILKKLLESDFKITK